MDDDIQEKLEERLAHIKMRRLEAVNESLNNSIERKRIPVSSASYMILNYVKETPDYLLPDVWPLPADKYKYRSSRGQRGQDLDNASGCCVIT